MNALYLVTVGGHAPMCMTLQEFIDVNENHLADPEVAAVRALLPGDRHDGDDPSLPWSVECMLPSHFYALEMIRLNLTDALDRETLLWATQRSLAMWSELYDALVLTEEGAQALAVVQLVARAA